MPTQIQLTGGAFEDSSGKVLANGHLDLVLNQDGVIAGVGQICRGITVRIQLDENGNAVSNPAQLVWGNDQMLPVNSYYIVSGFNTLGQRVWGPHTQQITGSSPFNLGSWTPNVLNSWTPSPQPVLFEVNGAKAGSQTLVNLVAGANTTVSDNGSGTWTVASSGGGGGSLTLQTNGTPNGSQTLLNLAAGSNITVADNGTGTVTISSSAASVQKYETTTIVNGSAASGSAFPYKGRIFSPDVTIDIYEVWGFLLSPVSGATYNAVIAQASSLASTTPTIASVPSVGNAVVNGTSTIPKWFRITFSSPVTLTSGTPYVMMFGRTDGGATYALPLNVIAATPIAEMQIPVTYGFIARIASTTPANGNSLDTSAGNTQPFSIGCVWAIH